MSHQNLKSLIWMKVLLPVTNMRPALEEAVEDSVQMGWEMLRPEHSPDDCYYSVWLFLWPVTGLQVSFKELIHQQRGTIVICDIWDTTLMTTSAAY